MVRVVRTESGVRLDPGQVLPGRGAYVHDQPECFRLAVERGGLARTLRASVPSSLLTDATAQAPSRSGFFKSGPGRSKDS